MSDIMFAGPNRDGSLDVAVVGSHVVASIYSVPSDDFGSRDFAVIEATPDQAEAIGQAFIEWAARARARRHSNAQTELFGFLP